jgi:hypothetical protein
VARVLRGATSAEFLASLATCHVVRGSRAGRALGVTLGALSDAEELPEPGDATTLLDLDGRGVSTLVHVRRVAGQNVWVWYLATVSDVVLVKVTHSPPTH